MKRGRTPLPRRLGAVGLTAALVAVITVFSGSGFAGNAAQAQYAPTNTTAPSISGTAQVGKTLTANPGSWSSSTQPSYAFQWYRCDNNGNNCAPISGATAQTYTVQSADAGHSLVVRVTATNSSGSTAATTPRRGVSGSAPSPSPQPAPAPAPTGGTIAAASVTLPNRLVIDGVKFQPKRLTSRAPFTAQFHVSDSSKRSVSGALVYALGLPYSWVAQGIEVRTNQQGWATMTIQPTAKMPVRRGGALVIFVRGRVQGQAVLGGTSTRRLVQVTMR